MIYTTEDLATEIDIDWNLFPPALSTVEATTVDPFGGSTHVLTPEDNLWKWKARLSGFVVPVIEEITVQQPKLPWLSVVLLLAVSGRMLYAKVEKSAVGPQIALGMSGLAIVLYPFARFAIDLPAVVEWIPSTERTADILDGLLTNVYRSFDVREEDRVYDRLAVSVTGDQLSEIYLQNRQSLELENRGGARAQVDEVEILEVSKIRRADDGFVAQALWRVSGSVSHFGHTHYRQNQYQANVNFVPVEGNWRIREIEVLDEVRVL